MDKQHSCMGLSNPCAFLYDRTNEEAAAKIPDEDCLGKTGRDISKSALPQLIMQLNPTQCENLCKLKEETTKLKEHLILIISKQIQILKESPDLSALTVNIRNLESLLTMVNNEELYIKTSSNISVWHTDTMKVLMCLAGEGTYFKTAKGDVVQLKHGVIAMKTENDIHASPPYGNGEGYQPRLGKRVTVVI